MPSRRTRCNRRLTQRIIYSCLNGFPFLPIGLCSRNPHTRSVRIAGESTGWKNKEAVRLKVYVYILSDYAEAANFYFIKTNRHETYERGYRLCLNCAQILPVKAKFLQTYPNETKKMTFESCKETMCVLPIMRTHFWVCFNTVIRTNSSFGALMPNGFMLGGVTSYTDLCSL